MSPLVVRSPGHQRQRHQNVPPLSKHSVAEPHFLSFIFYKIYTIPYSTLVSFSKKNLSRTATNDSSNNKHQSHKENAFRPESSPNTYGAT